MKGCPIKLEIVWRYRLILKDIFLPGCQVPFVTPWILLSIRIQVKKKSVSQLKEFIQQKFYTVEGAVSNPFVKDKTGEVYISVQAQYQDAKHQNNLLNNHAEGVLWLLHFTVQIIGQIWPGQFNWRVQNSSISPVNLLAMITVGGGEQDKVATSLFCLLTATKI